MANDPELLRNAIANSSDTTPVFATSYNDVREYYQDNYKKLGYRSWIGAYATALTGQSRGKEYRAARRSVEMYESGRQKTSVYAKEEKATAVGAQLPPVAYELKGNSITISIDGDQKDIRGGVETSQPRHIDVTFRGNDARQFVLNPTWADVWEEWGVPEELAEDGDYEVAVSRVSA